MKTKFLTHLLSFTLTVVFGFSMHSQSISGTVTDDNGVALPGATVLVQGTTNGVSTDFDGAFTISATSDDTLVFSFIGYASQSILVGSSSTINVSLSPDNLLDEVVVTGYGSQKTSNISGSVSIVSGEEVEKGIMLVNELIEKPEPEDAPSHLGILGRYVFTPELFRYQKDIGTGAGGEIQLTDAMQSLAQNSEMFSWTFHGKRYDIGTMKDWFQSHLELSANSEFSPILHEVLSKL